MLHVPKILTMTFVLLFVSGCAIDASMPIESVESDRGFYFGPITHELVCRCTCRSDNGNEQNPETHAVPSNGRCETLNNAQCELADSGGFGLLESCFKKSVPVSD